MRYDPETHRSGPYRARRGILLGVCKGLAEYFDVSVFGLRLVTVLIFIFTGFMPIVLIYFVLALLLPAEPVVPLHSEEEAEFYGSYTSSRRMALHRLKRTMEGLNRRVERMEHVVTGPDFDWERRFNE